MSINKSLITLGIVVVLAALAASCELPTPTPTVSPLAPPVNAMAAGNDCDLQLDFSAYQALPYGITSNSSPFIATILPAYSVTTTQAAVATYVADQDSSNYWRLDFRRLYPTQTTLFSVYSCDARSCPDGSWTVHLADQSNVTLDPSWAGVYVYAVKVGSPTGLYAASPNVCIEQ